MRKPTIRRITALREGRRCGAPRPKHRDIHIVKVIPRSRPSTLTSLSSLSRDGTSLQRRECVVRARRWCTPANPPLVPADTRPATQASAAAARIASRSPACSSSHSGQVRSLSPLPRQKWHSSVRKPERTRMSANMPVSKTIRPEPAQRRQRMAVLSCQADGGSALHVWGHCCAECSARRNVILHRRRFVPQARYPGLDVFLRRRGGRPIIVRDAVHDHHQIGNRRGLLFKGAHRAFRRSAPACRS